ncbi:MAG TPA: hypothetical protein VEA99_01085 [Gemmatimonadaceae bacterium]|nr:hypothetical protein [Gemmatimonadaceae bacterium]
MTAALLLALQLRVAAPAAVTPRAVEDRWFGADKAKHFLLAGVVQGMAYATLRAVDLRHGRAQTGALGFTIALAVGKERRDRRAYGHFSVRDIVWSAGGAAAAAALLSRTVR